MRNGKAKFVGAVIVMALWAMAAYSLGRYQGAKSGVGIVLPTVKVDWKGKAEEPKAEVKAEAKPEVKSEVKSDVKVGTPTNVAVTTEAPKK